MSYFRVLHAPQAMIVLACGVISPWAVPPLHAQAGDAVAAADANTDLVSYPHTFFERFRPVTALDMVRQVPGFKLDEDATAVRGFASAPGNVLINDRRPSAKQDSLSAILTRIPAVTVERVELIRGQVRSIDLRGQAVVVNLVLRADIPAAVQWELSVRRTFNHGPFKPEASVSLADNWNDIEYNVGLDARRSSVGREGEDRILGGDGMLEERRYDGRENRNTILKASLNAASWWGETYWRSNLSYNFADHNTYNFSLRVPEGAAGGRQSLVDNFTEQPVFEAGADLERDFHPDFTGKAILLYAGGEEEGYSVQRELDPGGGLTLLREARSLTDTTETIARLELDWSAPENHLVQANAERAYNVLDGRLRQTDDTGAGPVAVEVPGANTRVAETRWDFLLKDTWLLGSTVIDYGMGAERSTISQTGDAVQERSFFFLKPQGVFTYTSARGDQTRLELAREVAQLDLEGFISATVFEDDDLALGNPDIRPDTTWLAELSHDRRFGPESVVRLTVYHHWISDVLDLLPLSPVFEAPGNIGDGRRWGLEWESTMPLDWLGLASSKLNIKARWQDSSVVDPVTGENRVFSVAGIPGGPIVYDVENEYAYIIDYRQDFRAAGFAWGWSLNERAAQYRFMVNELEIYDEGLEINAFVETTRWFGIKTRIDLENATNFEEERIRSIYTGERAITPLASTELRNRTRGIRLWLTLSGAF